MTASSALPPGVTAVSTTHAGRRAYLLRRTTAEGLREVGGIIGAEVVLHGNSWVADGAVVVSGTLDAVHVPAGVTIESSSVESVNLSGFRGTITDSAVIGTGPASVLVSAGSTRLENALVEFGADTLVLPPGEWSHAHLGSRSDVVHAVAGDAQVSAVRVDGGVAIEVVNLAHDGVRSHRAQVTSIRELHRLIFTLPERFHAPTGDAAEAAMQLLRTAVMGMFR